MEDCFLCGKPAAKRVEVEVGSSVTSVQHDGHHDAQHHHRSHTDRGTTTHYALKPLCEACIKQREEEAAAALKVGGAIALGGMTVMGVMALVGCLAPFILLAVGGAFFYFFGHN